jgi:hypothetical protein
MPESAKMPRTVAAFVIVVVIAALATLPVLDHRGLTDRPLLLLVLLGTAVITSVRPVRIPGLKLHMTASHPFMLVALAAVGPLAAVLVGLISVLTAAVAAERAPNPTRLAFNLSAVALTGSAMSWVFGACGGAAGGSIESHLLPLSAAAMALFAANTGLVSAVIALERSRGLLATWRETFAWNAWTYFVGLSIAVATLAALETSPVWGVLLAAAPCWLLIIFYRSQGEAQAALEARRSS